jgi:hypothetical protein
MSMSATQQFLYRIQPTRPEMLIDGLTSEEEAIVEQHFAYLQDLLGQGILLLAGRTAEHRSLQFWDRYF